MADELVPSNQEELVPATLMQIVQAAIARLGSEGVSYGSYLPMEKIRELAGPLAETEVRFAFFKWNLAEALREQGLWLSERGLSGEGMRIATAVENVYYAGQAQHKALASLERATVLLHNTDLSEMNDVEKKRHENISRQIEHQRMMLLRFGEVSKVVHKYKPALLKQDISAEEIKLELDKI
jgi:hypothetical protein